MPAKPTSEDGALAAALKRVLARETDPRAKAWLKGLIAGDAPAKKQKAPRPKRAAA